ncbi:MAG: hypothetical protein OXI96_05050 [Acidimicrobiaceae bacterium]|nr:hypothetical protein [Acidimicrobiaceae bacterium]
MVADPTGAIVILWQPLKHHGACLVKEHSTTSWNELVTNDVGAAMGFYSVLLGWSGEPMGDSGLVGVRHAGSGGIIGSVTSASEGVVSHWSVYFAVDDCDAIVRHALRFGGRVVVPAADMTSGRAAQLADKHGVIFWVMDCGY